MLLKNSSVCISDSEICFSSLRCSFLALSLSWFFNLKILTRRAFQDGFSRNETIHKTVKLSLKVGNKLISFIGILGVGLFAIAAIVGGLLIDNYSVISQFISESFAINTQYGRALRTFGYVPSGILVTIFCFCAVKFFPKSKSVKVGFYGLAIFYGLGTILIGLFPCDAGCNIELIESSIAQFIHNTAASLTYIFVPINIIGIGIGLRQFPNYNRLSLIAITSGIVSAFFVFILIADPESDFKGLYQRIIESIFIIWIICCALRIMNGSTERING
jgi:hypothetical protein